MSAWLGFHTRLTITSGPDVSMALAFISFHIRIVLAKLIQEFFIDNTI
jgi:hypothetical protein